MQIYIAKFKSEIHSNTRYMFKCLSCLLITNLLLAYFNPCRADISWIKGVENCEQFSPAIKAYLDKINLSKYSLLPLWQKEEVAIALNQACNGKFSICNLEACKKWSSLITVKTKTSSNELSWLSRFLTCEQLMDQVKSRYSSLEQSELKKEGIKREIKLVLNTACSDRFTHCQFSSCKNISQGDIKKLTNKKKEKEFNYKTLQETIIKQAIKKEQSLGLTWKKFTNSQEEQVLARRREEIRSRKKEELDERKLKESNKPRRNLWTRPKRKKTGATPF